MNKILLFAFALAVFIAGCFHEPKASLVVKDCGTDEKCFEDAAQNCALAKVTVTSSTGAITAYEESKGYDGDNCVVYFKVTASQVPTFADKDMTCKFPKTTLSGFDAITSFNSQSAFTHCTGSLVEAIRSAG